SARGAIHHIRQSGLRAFIDRMPVCGEEHVVSLARGSRRKAWGAAFRRPSGVAAGVEALERRILLSGPIIFNATAADDTIQVTMTLTTLTITLNSVDFNYSTSGVTRVQLNAANGNDQIENENTNLPISLDTGSGNNVIEVQRVGRNLNFVSGEIDVLTSPG